MVSKARTQTKRKCMWLPSAGVHIYGYCYWQNEHEMCAFVFDNIVHSVLIWCTPVYGVWSARYTKIRIKYFMLYFATKLIKWIFIRVETLNRAMLMIFLVQLILVFSIHIIYIYLTISRFTLFCFFVSSLLLFILSFFSTLIFGYCNRPPSK